VEGAVRDLARLLFSATGRLPRSKFIGLSLGLSFAGALIAMPLTFIPGRVTLIPFFAIVALVDALWILAAIRRLHDRNRSGWWVCLYAVAALVAYGLATAFSGARHAAVLAGTVVNLAVVVWIIVDLYALRGDRGPNRFGPDPLSAS